MERIENNEVEKNNKKVEVNEERGGLLGQGEESYEMTNDELNMGRIEESLTEGVEGRTRCDDEVIQTRTVHLDGSDAGLENPKAEEGGRRRKVIKERTRDEHSMTCTIAECNAVDYIPCIIDAKECFLVEKIEGETCNEIYSTKVGDEDLAHYLERLHNEVKYLRGKLSFTRHVMDEKGLHTVPLTRALGYYIEGRKRRGDMQTINNHIGDYKKSIVELADKWLIKVEPMVNWIKSELIKKEGLDKKVAVELYRTRMKKEGTKEVYYKHYLSAREEEIRSNFSGLLEEYILINGEAHSVSYRRGLFDELANLNGHLQVVKKIKESSQGDSNKNNIELMREKQRAKETIREALAHISKRVPKYERDNDRRKTLQKQALNKIHTHQLLEDENINKKLIECTLVYGEGINMLWREMKKYESRETINKENRTQDGTGPNTLVLGVGHEQNGEKKGLGVLTKKVYNKVAKPHENNNNISKSDADKVSPHK